jgi:hypothetical protein
MKLFRKCLAILCVGVFLFSFSACSGMDSLNENLKNGVEDLSDNVTIGKSNALITPYRSFDGTRTSDNTAFQATYNVTVSGFDGQDILVGNTNLKDKDCRSLTIHYLFTPISGSCQLIYIDPELEETVLADSGEGDVTVQLKTGANYIGIYGINYDGNIQITVE